MKYRTGVLACGGGLLLCTSAQGVLADTGAGQIFPDASFEELAAVPISSVSRRSQVHLTTPAAIHVIHDSDIRNSGARNLAEILRLAPGVEVARLNAHRYAVGIRGYTNEFTTKLLVLQDGRSLYTPLFAGTFWDMQDTFLNDVAQIEVVRGPGGTAWGANAVNGVINIVTKSAWQTQGWLATVGGGTEERQFAGVRYGGRLGNDGAFRIFAQSAERDETAFADGTGADDGWRQHRVGMRIDTGLAADDQLVLNGEWYEGGADQITRGAPTDIDVEGGFLSAKWTRQFKNRTSISVQSYYDDSARMTSQGIADKSDFVVDAVYSIRAFARHQITSGIRYWRSENQLRTDAALIFDPPKRALTFAGAFVDDAMSFFDDAFTISAGAKFEYNDFTNWEWMPNARIVWKLASEQAVWAGYARGLRTPSIADHDSTTEIPGFSARSNPNLPPESIDSFEVGWRATVNDNLWIDTTAFYNRYDHLRTREESFIAVPPTLVTTRDSKMHGTSVGADLVLGVAPTDRIRIDFSGSYLNMDLTPNSDSTDMRSYREKDFSPRWQFSVQATARLGANLSISAFSRYVHRLPALDVDAYAELDLRFAWRPNAQFEAAIVGQNLLHGRHREFVNDFVQPESSELQRGGYLMFTWRQ